MIYRSKGAAFDERKDSAAAATATAATKIVA
jgi:hypothetical protein